MEHPLLGPLITALWWLPVLVAFVALPWWLWRRMVSGTRRLTETNGVGTEGLLARERRLAYALSRSSRFLEFTFWGSFFASFMAIGWIVVALFLPERPSPEAIVLPVAVTGAVFFASAFALLVPRQVVGRVLVPQRHGRLRRQLSEDDRPPVVLLRSFVRSTLWLRHGQFYRGKYDMPNFTEFHIGALTSAAAGFGPVIALGEAPLNLFSGQPAESPIDVAFVATTDDDWRDAAITVLGACRFALLLPGDSPSLLEELELLRQAGPGKSFVLMPPPTAREEFRLWDEMSLRCYWNALRDALAARGCSLPEYTAEGLLYLARPDLSIAQAASLRGRADAAAMSQALQQLVPYLSPAPASAGPGWVQRLQAVTGGRALAPTDGQRERHHVERVVSDHAMGSEFHRVRATVLAVQQVTSADGQPYAIFRVHFLAGEGDERFTWCAGNPKHPAPSVGDEVFIRYRLADALLAQWSEPVRAGEAVYLTFVTVTSLIGGYFTITEAPPFVGVTVGLVGLAAVVYAIYTFARR